MNSTPLICSCTFDCTCPLHYSGFIRCDICSCFHSKEFGNEFHDRILSNPIEDHEA